MPASDKRKHREEERRKAFAEALDVQLEQIREYVLDNVDGGIMKKEWAPIDAIVVALRMNGVIK